MNPLISIIVPVYNVEQYLPRCLDSIIQQTYSNLEIILVDDGSTDSGGALCDEYAQKDNRIQVIHQQNAGLGPARNAGMKICTGDYVSFIDSDDFIPLDSIEALYKRICEDNSDLVIGNCVNYYEDDSAGPLSYSLNNETISAKEVFERFAVFDSIPVSAWGKLYKREVLKNIQYPVVRIGEDMLVFPYIIEHCSRISIENRNVYYYFQRSNSLMKEKTEQAKTDRVYAILHTASYFWNNGYRESTPAWYSFAAKIALSIKNRKERLATFYHFFDRKSRKWLWWHLDIKGKIVWFCLFLPLIYYVQRRLFPALNYN